MKVLLYCTKASPYLLPSYSVEGDIKLGTQLYNTSKCKDIALNGLVCGECEIHHIERIIPLFFDEVSSFNGYAIHLKNISVLKDVKSIESFKDSEEIIKHLKRSKNMIPVIDNGETKILLPVKSEDLNKILNKDKTVVVTSSIIVDLK